MVVSDLSLVRLNSSQVDDSHQAVEATVSRPAKKDSVYLHEKTGLEIVEMRGERQHNAIILSTDLSYIH